MENFNLFPAWKQCVKTLLESGLTYGSTVRKDAIASMCNLVEPTTIAEKSEYDLQLLSFISEIRKTLLTDHQMLLATNYDGSFRIIEPREQTAFAIECGAKSIAREMRRMSEGVQYVNTSLLNQDERRKNADAQAKISMLAGMQSSKNQELIAIATS